MVHTFVVVVVVVVFCLSCYFFLIFLVFSCVCFFSSFFVFVVIIFCMCVCVCFCLICSNSCITLVLRFLCLYNNLQAETQKLIGAAAASFKVRPLPADKVHNIALARLEQVQTSFFSYFTIFCSSCTLKQPMNSFDAFKKIY